MNAPLRIARERPGAEEDTVLGMGGDYHDYFIKNGRHVGRYEEMYRECEDPWNIEALGARLDMRAALLLLEGRAACVNDFLDVGAGLGFFSGLLCRAVWLENPEARGVITDISPTAAARAAERLADPRLRFMAFDARSLGRESPFPPASFDLVVMAQVLWGLLEDLPAALSGLAGLLRPEGLLLLSQHFPGRENQSYGAEVVASPEDLVEHMVRTGLVFWESLETNRPANHHWAGLFKAGNAERRGRP